MKKQLLLAGLISGAMALGVGCKTDSTNRPGPETQQPMGAPTDSTGMGGAGHEQVPPPAPPPPDDGIREREPDVHHAPINEPGTGGSGTRIDDGIDRPDIIGNDTVDDSMNKAPPVDSTLDNSMSEDTAIPQR